MDSKKEMSAYDSQVIEKQLEEVKNIIDNADGFFFNKTPKDAVLNIIIECEDVFEWIKEYME